MSCFKKSCGSYFSLELGRGITKGPEQTGSSPEGVTKQGDAVWVK